MGDEHGKRSAGLALLGLLLASACATPSAGSAADASWSRSGDGYGRSIPLQDFYDIAVVRMTPGASAPSELSLQEVADLLSNYDVVLFGESHNHSGIHQMQQELFRELHLRRRDLALSMEQFERDVQPIVDSYLAGRIGENALRESGRAWDNYLTSYRPLVEYARQNRLPVVAANAPNWAIVCIGQQGAEVLDRFSREDRQQVASELDLGPGAYRDKFLAFAGGSSTHGGGGAPSPEAEARANRSYAAQVARDETMAESILRAREGRPNRLVLHLNGSFHSSGFLGVGERLLRRQPNLKVAVIEPVEVESAETPRFKADTLALGTVLLVAHPSPPLFVDGEDQSAWVAGMMARRRASQCRYPVDARPATN